jgi:hypothetical protein
MPVVESGHEIPQAANRVVGGVRYRVRVVGRVVCAELFSLGLLHQRLACWCCKLRVRVREIQLYGVGHPQRLSLGLKTRDARTDC